MFAWKSQNSEFQCLEMTKFRIPVSGKVKIQNVQIMFKNSQRLEMLKSRIPMFGKA